MYSVSSHHNRLVLPGFTAIACPLTVQPDKNLHRWAPGTKLFFAEWARGLGMRKTGNRGLTRLFAELQMGFPFVPFTHSLIEIMCN